MIVPAVSVILPAYNCEKYIAQAIESVLQQTFTDLELIIINDGSIDKTESIILSFSDPRIIYLKNEINRGLIFTLNKAIEIAQGNYIARMDADDISLPARIGKAKKIS
jgi:glycosyltransferase involved in cell wall biosynthesis